MTFDRNEQGKTVDICDCCGKELHSFLDYGVMVKDDIWKKVEAFYSIDPNRGLLCYECMFRTLYSLGIDPFDDAMTDCPWNDDLSLRTFLESEDFEYEYMLNSKRHRLWHVDAREKECWHSDFKLDFTSFTDLMTFSQFLLSKTYPSDSAEQKA